MSRAFVIVVILCAALAAPATAAAACPDADLAPAQGNVARIRSATLCLLNEQRAAKGLQPLRAQATLRAVALRYARSMVDLGFFDHRSPDGDTMISRIRDTTYLRSTVAWSVGENLAWGSGDLATPAATVRAWMRSAGHRANVLDARFRDIGIGISLGAPTQLDPGEHGATYVTEFGRRLRK